MQMEASLRSQSVSVEQMANRIEDIADNDILSLTTMTGHWQTSYTSIQILPVDLLWTKDVDKFS